MYMFGGHLCTASKTDAYPYFYLNQVNLLIVPWCLLAALCCPCQLFIRPVRTSLCHKPCTMQVARLDLKPLAAALVTPGAGSAGSPDACAVDAKGLLEAVPHAHGGATAEL